VYFRKEFYLVGKYFFYAMKDKAHYLKILNKGGVKSAIRAFKKEQDALLESLNHAQLSAWRDLEHKKTTFSSGKTYELSLLAKDFEDFLQDLDFPQEEGRKASNHTKTKSTIMASDKWPKYTFYLGIPAAALAIFMILQFFGISGVSLLNSCDDDDRLQIQLYPLPEEFEGNRGVIWPSEELVLKVSAVGESIPKGVKLRTISSKVTSKKLDFIPDTSQVGSWVSLPDDYKIRYYENGIKYKLKLDENSIRLDGNTLKLGYYTEELTYKLADKNGNLIEDDENVRVKLRFQNNDSSLVVQMRGSTYTLRYAADPGNTGFSDSYSRGVHNGGIGSSGGFNYTAYMPIPDSPVNGEIIIKLPISQD